MKLWTMQFTEEEIRMMRKLSLGTRNQIGELYRKASVAEVDECKLRDAWLVWEKLSTKFNKARGIVNKQH